MQSFMPIYLYTSLLSTYRQLKMASPLFGAFEKRAPGARFSTTYRAREAIFNDLYLKKKAVYRY